MNRKERRQAKMAQYTRLSEAMANAAENIRRMSDPEFRLAADNFSSFAHARDRLASNAFLLLPFGLKFDLPPEVASKVNKFAAIRDIKAEARDLGITLEDGDWCLHGRHLEFFEVLEEVNPQMIREFPWGEPMLEVAYCAFIAKSKAHLHGLISRISTPE